MTSPRRSAAWWFRAWWSNVQFIIDLAVRFVPAPVRWIWSAACVWHVLPFGSPLWRQLAELRARVVVEVGR